MAPRINLRNESVIHQIECPTLAAKTYNTTLGDLSKSSIPYVFGEAIPNAIGYINYNFSALGSNDASRTATQMGLSGKYADSARVLGYNYFHPTGGTCNSRSEKKCVGKPQYIYIRNYPVGKIKGNLTFGVFNDVVDLNPIPLIKSVVMPGKSSQCKKTSALPVGSFLDNPSLTYKNKATFEKAWTVCKKNCVHILDESTRDNCFKKCKRGHWTESQCISVIMSKSQNEHFSQPSLEAQSRDVYVWGVSGCIVFIASLLFVMSVVGPTR
jgi:hypothetical protein